jgi:hypothetical protein
MPDDILIRDARSDEANFAAEMTRKMVIEMQGMAAALRPHRHQPGRKLPRGSLTTLNLRPPNIS